jgi:hypothetical protein
MNREEYKQLNSKLEKELREKLKDQDISIRVSGLDSRRTLFILDTEAYIVYNDGDRADWQYMGQMRA